MLTALGKIWLAVLWAMMIAAALYVAAILCAITYSVLWRNLGWSYTPYSIALIEYGFLYILFLGAPLLVRERGHVFVELLIGALPTRTRTILSRGIAGFCAAICFVWAWYTGQQFLFYWNDPMSFDPLRAGLDLKLWISTLPMPVGFAAMGVEFLLLVGNSRLMHDRLAE
jgi:TRAP-type C4-dicarboxylate transport system permease small subunit